MNDNLDWDRLRSGDLRALDPDHQDIFNMVYDLQAEVELLREENTKLWGRWESAEQTCGRMQRRINSLEDEIEREHERH